MSIAPSLVAREAALDVGGGVAVSFANAFGVLAFSL
jgi:hypothetical protein